MTTPNIIDSSLYSKRTDLDSKNSGLGNGILSAAQGSTKPGQPVAVAGRRFKAGDVLFAYNGTDDTLPSLRACHPVVPEIRKAKPANVQCRATYDGESVCRYSLFAIKNIEAGDHLRLHNYDRFIPEGIILLLRFDGSCKKRRGDHFCGAGIVIYLISNDAILSHNVSIAAPLPGQHDPMQAEARAAAIACKKVLALFKILQYVSLQVIVQGGNKPVIDYNAGLNRFRDPCIFELFNPISKAIFESNRKVQWKHIPREHNPVADGLANEGADAVLDGTYSARLDAEGYLVRPDTSSVHRPFDAQSLPVVEEDAIRYLSSLGGETPARETLILPEHYAIPHFNPAELRLNKDLATIAKFLRARSELAQYSTAHGHLPLSRHYTRNGGVVGGAVIKAARHLLLCDHYEDDISSAFHTFYSSFAAGLDSPLTAPFASAIEFVRSQLRPNPDS